MARLGSMGVTWMVGGDWALDLPSFRLSLGMPCDDWFFSLGDEELNFDLLEEEEPRVLEVSTLRIDSWVTLLEDDNDGRLSKDDMEPIVNISTEIVWG